MQKTLVAIAILLLSTSASADSSAVYPESDQVATRVGSDWIWDDIRNSPEAMGALFGSLIGLLGVAASAYLGFASLIRAQNHQAQLTRQRDEAIRLEEKKVIVRAIVGELSANFLNMEGSTQAFRDEIKSIKEDPEPYDNISLAEVFRTSLPQIMNDIFHQNAPKIGLMDSDICTTIVIIYGCIGGTRDPAEYKADFTVEAVLQFAEREVQLLEKSKNLIIRAIKKIATKRPELFSRQEVEMISKYGWIMPEEE